MNRRGSYRDGGRGARRGHRWSRPRSCGGASSDRVAEVRSDVADRAAADMRRQFDADPRRAGHDPDVLRLLRAGHRARVRPVRRGTCCPTRRWAPRCWSSASRRRCGDRSSARPAAGRSASASAGSLRRSPGARGVLPRLLPLHAGWAGELPIGLDLAADPVAGQALRGARDGPAPGHRARDPARVRPPGADAVPADLPPGAPAATVAERRGATKALVASSFEARQLGWTCRRCGPEGTLIQILDGGRRIFGPAGQLDDAVTGPWTPPAALGRARADAGALQRRAAADRSCSAGWSLSALVGALLVALGRRQRAHGGRPRTPPRSASGAPSRTPGVGMALVGVGRRPDAGRQRRALRA